MRTRRVLAGVLLTALALDAPAAAQTVDPAYRFRTLRTPHFAIQFHQGEADTAARLAGIAEDVWLSLRNALAATPPATTQVILVDQTDSANGWATPVPRDTVMVSATWPSGVEFIGSTDDWLRLVFTHEFTHITHLTQSRAWAGVVRRVFGRVPVAFPNLLLPIWQIEGLATYEESAISGEGRLHAGDFRAVVDEAALEHRLEPMDRVNGGLVAWPAGYGAYGYGLAFNAYLVDRFGSDATAALAADTSGSLPYFWPRAYRRVYGQPLGSLWRDFDAHLRDEAASPDARASAAAAAADAAVRLTHDGFAASGPRIVPPPCGGCSMDVLYSASSPHGFPAILRVPLDASTRPERLADRTSGSTMGASGDTVVFDESELHRNVGFYPDLVRLDRRTGARRALTRDARLSDADLSPDGTTIVAVRARADRRELVVVPATAARPLGPRDVVVIASAPETQFNAPRWSPDGTAVAVERHRLGAYPELVIVTVATRAVRVAATSPRVRWVTPAWRPDGRAIVGAADIGEGAFNLYEVPLDGAPVRALTHTTGGATWPDVTPDGQTIVFVGYTADGFDIFRAPYRPDATHAVDLATMGDADSPVARPSAPAASTPYSPWPTLAPTSWAPTLDASNRAWRAGAAVAGSDVLGYHAYAFAPSWFVSQPAGARTSSNAPDFSASYTYARWPVQPWISASRSTSFFNGAPDAAGTPTPETAHEYDVEIGVTAVRARVHDSQAARVSFLRATAQLDDGVRTAAFDRSAVRAAWTIVTARTYGYSISREGGIAAGVTAEVVRRAFGADADATVWTGDLRAYLPGAARHHVIALRAGGGASRGDVTAGRVFLLGGAAPAPAPADYGSEAFSLLRGFAPDSFAGTRVALVNADYRLPLATVERGLGPLPIFLRTLSAAIFTDAGAAWVDRLIAADRKIDVGAEVSGDLTLGYTLPLTIAAGAAWAHDGAGAIPNGWQAFVRVGRAF